jgi:hypothetical protein
VLPAEAFDRLEQSFGMTGYKEYSDAPWALVTQASFPDWMWPGIFFSWLSLKGHLQSYYELTEDYFLATKNEEQILGIWTLGFGNRPALEQFMESAYTIAQMLASMGVPEEDIHVSLHREYS